jgi:hypothetical protein
MTTGTGERTAGSPSQVLTAEDATELGELLRFLCDLFVEAPAGMAGLCGDAYLVEELREDLARFALLVVGAGRSALGDIR